MIKNQNCKFLVKGGGHCQLEFLLETNDLNEVKECINSFASKKVKKVYYYRFNYCDECIWIDFGSWLAFIFIFMTKKLKKNF